MAKRNHVKTLKNKAGKLWKEYCYLRDGKKCQVKKFYPEIEIQHGGAIVVDHCFSRANKFLFFEPSNGTVVCQNCNNFKHLDMKSVSRAIDEIVVRREGLGKYDEMRAIDERKGGNANFSKIWWLEEQIEKLQKAIELLQQDMGIYEMKAR